MRATVKTHPFKIEAGLKAMHPMGNRKREIIRQWRFRTLEAAKRDERALLKIGSYIFITLIDNREKQNKIIAHHN